MQKGPDWHYISKQLKDKNKEQVCRKFKYTIDKYQKDHKIKKPKIELVQDLIFKLKR